MGSAEGEPVVYRWLLYYHLASLILLVVLVGLVFLPPNRAPSAVVIVLLAVALPMLASWLLDESGFARYATFLHASVAAFVFAVAFLWLLSYKLTNRGRIATLAYAFFLLTFAGFIGLLDFSDPGFRMFMHPAGLSYIGAAFAVFLALALAGAACRKRYSPLRYLVWFFVLLVPGIGGLLMFLISMVRFVSSLVGGHGVSRRYLYFLLEEHLGVGLIGGVVLFVLMLPFLALALWSPTFRPRFYAIYRLPGMQDAAENTSCGMEET